MKLAILGESTAMPSGFGQQVNLLAQAFVDAKQDVTVICPRVGLSKPTESRNFREWRTTKFQDVAELDRILHTTEPQAVLCFYHTMMCGMMAEMRAAPANVPVVFWLPWEGVSLPNLNPTMFTGIPENHVVHLTKHAADLWQPRVKSNVVIPHAIAPEYVFSEWGSTVAKRAQWADILRFPIKSDSVVVLCVDRNVSHKRWDCVFDYVRQLQQKTGRDVQLIAHTRMIEPGNKGFAVGYNLPELEKIYGLVGKVAYTGFDWMASFSRYQLAELYTLADVRISMSEGEGFGIPTLEAAATGCPQVLNGVPATVEIQTNLGGPGFGLEVVPPAGTGCRDGVLWSTPNVAGMVEKTCDLLWAKPPTKSLRSMQSRAVHEKYSVKQVAGMWLDHLAALTLKPSTVAAYKCRRGYSAAAVEVRKLKHLAEICDKFFLHDTIVHVGAFDGVFEDECLERGLTIRGVEEDGLAFGMQSERARLACELRDYTDEWPKGSVLLFGDVFDCIASKHGMEGLRKTLDRSVYYNWLIFRMQDEYQWGRPCVDKAWIPEYLESKEMTRRQDLEEVLRKELQLDFSEYQLWQHRAETHKLPKGYARKG